MARLSLLYVSPRVWPAAALAILLLLAMAAGAQAQTVSQTISVQMQRCQSVLAPDPSMAPIATGLAMGFRSNDEALKLVRRISAKVGLAANFVVMPGPSKGGASAITCYDMTNRQVRRLIIYQPSFIDEIRRKSPGYWALIGMLAHEIGHHANGHNFYRTWGHDKELEADHFSGFVMARMGATLEEALAGVRAYVDPISTSTHPGRSEREAAVETGWQAARHAPLSSAREGKPRRSPHIVRVPVAADARQSNAGPADKP